MIKADAASLDVPFICSAAALSTDDCQRQVAGEPGVLADGGPA